MATRRHLQVGATGSDVTRFVTHLDTLAPTLFAVLPLIVGNTMLSTSLVVLPVVENLHFYMQ